MQFLDRPSVMRRAFELAAQGHGLVEPNPMVGAVLVDRNLRLIGEGFHQRYGGPHAEVEALRDAQARGNGGHLEEAELYVTLEPCCHFGKTPPCTQAILAAGIKKVVVGRTDPAPYVDGGGIAALRAAGVEIEVGFLEEDAKRLTTPFAKRIKTGRPYVIAKWAMTWDGKIATRTGDSKWISNEESRAIVHRIRGRVDAVIIGAETARQDDPALTARPAGPRVATRVVMDSIASLRNDSQLVRTIAEAPLLIVTGPDAPADNIARLQAVGAEVCVLGAAANDEAARPASAKEIKRIRHVDPVQLLDELGRRGMTNVLVEGGGAILGAFADLDLIDEVHVFLGSKLIGGQAAPSPISGLGCGTLMQALSLEEIQVEVLDRDIHLQGAVSGHRW